MEVAQYSDKSIVVRGDTRSSANDLKSLGGKYNSRLTGGPGWIFPLNRQDDILNFVGKSGTSSQREPIPSSRLPSSIEPRSTEIRRQPTSSVRLPSIPRPTEIRREPSQAVESISAKIEYPNVFEAADGVLYQLAIYTVPMPVIGQLVTLTTANGSANYEVTGILSEMAPFDIIDIASDQDQYRAVIINGKWQIPNSEEEHTLTFQRQ